MKTITPFRGIFKIYILFILISMFISCSSTTVDETIEMEEETSETDESSDETQEPEDTDYDITTILEIFDAASNVVSYSVNGDNVTITTGNLPNHVSPYYQDTEWHNDYYADYDGTNAAFHLNPNRISEQNITFTIPLHPESASTKEDTPMGPMGVSRNGVVFFNQYAAGREDLDGEINSFDQYLGHPTGTGAYHYHIEPTYLTDTFGEDALLGLLADGFPVYGPKENGVTIASEDLDDYHGHYGETTEFPNGIYHYHVTADAPYINGNGFYGTPGTISQ